MPEIVVVSLEKLKIMIHEAVREVIPKPDKQEPEIDTITLSDAVSLLCLHGYPTSKAKIYQLTSSGKIPYRKYGNRLVFSQKELLQWAKSQIKSVNDHSESLLALAKSARRRL